MKVVKKVGKAATTAAAATVTAPVAPAAAVGVAPGWGGYYPPPMYPYQQPQQYTGGWGADSWGGAGAQFQQPAGFQQETARISKAQKVARFPCDNCGQIGHWSYSMDCPNYDAYLAKQKAKSEALRKSGGSGGAGGGSTSGIVALRTNPGREKTIIY